MTYDFKEVIKKALAYSANKNDFYLLLTTIQAEQAHVKDGDKIVVMGKSVTIKVSDGIMALETFEYHPSPVKEHYIKPKKFHCRQCGNNHERKSDARYCCKYK